VVFGAILKSRSKHFILILGRKMPTCKLPSKLQAINRRQTKKNKPEQMMIVPFEIEKSNDPMRNKQIGII
jgi:hypothetical protein